MLPVSCVIWDVDPVLLSFGNKNLYWYGLLFAISLLIGYALLYWQFNRARLVETYDDTRRFVLLVAYVIAGVIVGAYVGDRIFYRWDSFITDPLGTLSLYKYGFRGLSSHGAGVGILTVVFLYHLQFKIRYFEILDRLSFSVAVSSAMVRLGNLMNSEIVGRKSEVAWAFCFSSYDEALIPRHPSQIYEFFIGLGVLILLLIVDKKAGKEERPLGLLCGTFLSAYFPLRFFVEFFKEYQTLHQEIPFTMGQFISIPFMVLGPCILIWSLKNRLPAGRPEQ